MSRTFRKQLIRRCYRHPKGSKQFMQELLRAKEDGVKLRFRLVPQAWDDIQPSSECFKYYDILDDLRDVGVSWDQIFNLLHKKWRLTSAEANIVLSKRDFRKET